MQYKLYIIKHPSITLKLHTLIEFVRLLFGVITEL